MNNGVFATVAVVILICAVINGFNHGQSVGREQVASGMVTCSLVENIDKTSDWQCD